MKFGLRLLSLCQIKADAEDDKTRQSNFSIINFFSKIILIGGTGYTGEINEAVFPALNFLLDPRQ
ncbi:phosphoenolpyruvate carboxykinase (ATP) [Pedobacter sp. HMF7647]|uniref:Phosphoenolpyruvate carboxykinase (ATP) n=1 Tax=Hufsiella arboris TaxID=2695275 RepID=A0A7K1YF51_9SPHI|nr:phosphoenolpyruvate carboxykinase (ATP) [Hufsiella arboris]